MSIDSLVTQTERKYKKIDRLASISYSLAIGVPLDLYSGLSITGMLASRSQSFGVNYATGRYYGKWQDHWYHQFGAVKDASYRFLRERAADLIAFNTFQTPFYAGIVAIADYITTGEVHREKVENSIESAGMLSIWMAPTYNLWINFCRKRAGLKTSVELAQENPHK
ncbi:L-alanine exporter AlaE [Candidatus Woesearchaeota archaeon]|nr:L-alanine exporter AlaE [Candidatus Woesearchaeota archaeon]